jgi:hypothetical protein
MNHLGRVFALLVNKTEMFPTRLWFGVAERRGQDPLGLMEGPPLVLRSNEGRAAGSCESCFRGAAADLIG